MNLKNDPSPRKILVVDDNPDIHHDFEIILCEQQRCDQLDHMEAEIFGQAAPPPCLPVSYQLSFASQGRQAVDLVRQSFERHNPFQLAFVDMRMPPGIDGLETIELLWKIDPHLQIVLCTAFSDYSWEQIEQRLQRTENLLILKKPFDVSEVAQMASTLTKKWLLTQAAMLKQEELESIVAERTKALRETNRRLEAEIVERRQLAKQLIRAQKMEAIGTLAAGVAHDLNNILSGIVSYPDIILQQIGPQHPIYQKLQLIQRSGRKAAAIVQDMLTLGRRGVTNQEPVDLVSLVNDYVQSPEWAKIRSCRSNVKIETSTAPGASCIDGTDVQISKALMNLTSNAVEAMPGGGTITLSLEEHHLTEDYDGYEKIPAGNYVVLGVADTGQGISKKDLEHIFEPFYTKKKMGRSGTGLGLAVVWGVVRDHKGFIDVRSRPGFGTIIELYFPDTGNKISDAVTDTVTVGHGGQDAHILVVDDIHEQRQIAVEMIMALGYSAEAVASGEAALAYLQSQSADLLLLDMAMDPGMDGLETYEQALTIRPLQRAIIASGFTQNDRVKKALSAGTTAFLNKPYRLNELAEAIKTVLAK